MGSAGAVSSLLADPGNHPSVRPLSAKMDDSRSSDTDRLG